MPYPGQTNTDVMHFVASGGRLDPPEKCPARLYVNIFCNYVILIKTNARSLLGVLMCCYVDKKRMT